MAIFKKLDKDEAGKMFLTPEKVDETEKMLNALPRIEILVLEALVEPSDRDRPRTSRELQRYCVASNAALPAEKQLKVIDVREGLLQLITDLDSVVTKKQESRIPDVYLKRISQCYSSLTNALVIFGRILNF